MSIDLRLQYLAHRELRNALLENDAKAIAQVWRRFHTRIAQDPAARRRRHLNPSEDATEP